MGDPPLFIYFKTLKPFPKRKGTLLGSNFCPDLRTIRKFFVIKTRGTDE